MLPAAVAELVAWPCAILSGVREYYERRAPEYDDWWNGTGLFAQRERPGWHDEVRALVEAIRKALEPHLRVEEALLFPAIHGRSLPHPPSPTLAELVQTMETEHDHAGDLLAALRRATSAYEVPPDAWASYRSLFERLEALELDTHLHVLKENHALLPALRRITG